MNDRVVELADKIVDYESKPNDDAIRDLRVLRGIALAASPGMDFICKIHHYGIDETDESELKNLALAASLVPYLSGQESWRWTINLDTRYATVHKYFNIQGYRSRASVSWGQTFPDAAVAWMEKIDKSITHETGPRDLEDVRRKHRAQFSSPPYVFGTTYQLHEPKD